MKEKPNSAELVVFAKERALLATVCVWQNSTELNFVKYT